VSITELTRTIVPTGSERTLATEDLIVSKTDLRGHLTYVNHTFIEISKFAEHELIGKPHNLIRHPDMPRSVFKLLWDPISQGEELLAYVVNLAADGAHYWVLAHVTPSFDERGRIVGYHSSRRAPSRRAVDQIAPIYAHVKAVENTQSTARAATEAGTEALNEFLASRGLDYDTFVWSMINSGEHS
jgi:PAS domain S-box-containing protein